jgi:ABC-type sugar transport system permease subunit
MVSWSKRRKILTVLLFTGPTIIGILLFNIYPILLSVYTSFTNRNRFRLILIVRYSLPVSSIPCVGRSFVPVHRLDWGNRTGYKTQSLQTMRI